MYYSPNHIISGTVTVRCLLCQYLCRPFHPMVAWTSMPWDKRAWSSRGVFTLERTHTNTSTHTQTQSHRSSISRPSRCCDAGRVKINVTAEPYCALPPLSISFIHRRVIGSQFELPLCLLWAHFALTECGRLMATSSRGRLASASMSALNSLHQFPPVLRSPTHTHKNGGKKGRNERMKRDKSEKK